MPKIKEILRNDYNFHVYVFYEQDGEDKNMHIGYTVYADDATVKADVEEYTSMFSWKEASKGE